MIMKANTKKEGWKLCQKDSIWGYAIAHIIPFVWIFLSSIKTKNYSLFINIHRISHNRIFAPEEVSNAFAILVTLFLAKAGISQTKKYGALKIKELKN